MRRVQLETLKGIEDRCWVQVAGCGRVFAIADEDMERENEVKTSAVHFLRFELSPAMAAKLKGGAALSIGIDHPNYQHRDRARAGDNVRSAASIWPTSAADVTSAGLFLLPLDRGVHQVRDADRGRDQAEQRAFAPARHADGEEQHHADEQQHDAAAQ